VRNGNYLGITELLSQLGPFFCEYINKYGKAGKEIPSYLSVTICEEIVQLMSSKVLPAIANETQNKNIFLIFVNSTYLSLYVKRKTFALFVQMLTLQCEHFISMTVTNASGEHSFSKFKFVNNE
jgi:hypothetical protein